MFVDLPNRNIWHELNEELATRLLPGSSKIRVQAYLGVEHALRELGLALPLMFTHKRHMAFISSCGFHFQALQIELSRQGFQVQSLTREGEIQKAWTEGIPKGLLFTALELDHPITGEKYDWTVWREALNERKIFSIGLSHQRALPEKEMDLLPYEIRLVSVGPQRAVALLGARVQLRPLTVDSLPWNGFTLEEFLPEPIHKEYKESVLPFEMAKEHLGRPFWLKEVSRWYDRALLYWTDVDGQALVEEIQKESPIELSSFSSWQRSFLQQDLQKLLPELSLEQRRGLIVFSAKDLEKNKNLPELIGKTYLRLKKRQSLRLS